jgi:hypothetical protein
VELKDIKAIIDLMKKNSITEFELEEKDSKLRLKRGLNGGSVAQTDDFVPMIPDVPVVLAMLHAGCHRCRPVINPVKLTSNHR